MIDGELGTNVSDSSQVDEQEKILESKISKAVDKLKFYLEKTDELIENNEISELRVASKRTDEIRDELNDLISHVQELKLDSGNTTQRAIRLWKKDLKRRVLHHYWRNRRRSMEY
jgi:NTP pyrophosphatase (non-canonical NTP hydrolase)